MKAIGRLRRLVPVSRSVVDIEGWGPEGISVQSCVLIRRRLRACRCLLCLSVVLLAIGSIVVSRAGCRLAAYSSLLVILACACEFARHTVAQLSSIAGLLPAPPFRFLSVANHKAQCDIQKKENQMDGWSAVAMLCSSIQMLASSSSIQADSVRIRSPASSYIFPLLVIDAPSLCRFSKLKNSAPPKIAGRGIRTHTGTPPLPPFSSSDGCPASPLTSPASLHVLRLSAGEHQIAAVHLVISHVAYRFSSNCSVRIVRASMIIS